MRSLRLLLLLGCGLLAAYGLPNLAPKSAKPEVVSTEIATLQPLSQELALLEKRNPGLAIIAVANVAFSAISWAVGLFGLATSAYSVAKDCFKQFNRSDCVLSSLGLVISAFTVNYKYQSLKFRVRSDGLDVHGFWEDPLDKRIVHEVHVPVKNGMLWASSVETGNNGTWVRHATRYFNGEETHHLMYRTAVPDDLGFENDGSYHHYRVQDANRDNHQSLTTREERSSYKVVSDYLWKYDSQSNWQLMHDEINVNDMKNKVGNWYQDHQVEAGCMVPVGTIASHGGSSSFGVDQGVLAYGWNNQPFGFNGRAGGWIDTCKY